MSATRRTHAGLIAALSTIAGLLASSGCQHAGSDELAQASASIPAAPYAAQPGRGERADARATGRVETARTGIRAFAPEERITEVDAERLSLHRVFDALGVDASMWYQHVQTLANPYFEGRAPGTEGIERAADYIEYYMRQYGLEPAFPEAEAAESGAWTSYRQPFDFSSPRPKIEFVDANLAFGDETLEHGEDYVLMGNSAVAAVTAPVTFVGYGIESGPSDYTSYEEDADLSGRIALLLRYEPLDESGKSQWAPRNFSTHASLNRKMRSLAERGVAGILMVNPPGAVDGRSGLESIGGSTSFRRQLDVPVAQVTAETADALLAAADAERRDLATLRRLADQSEVRTVRLDDAVEVTLAADLDVEARLYTANIGGVLPGRGDLADEWIVVGAHYDHVGFGYTGTRPGNVGKLHPGADDNASGTAGLLIVADRMGRAYEAVDEDADLRSLLFIAFSAEEAGLHGAGHYVEHPTVQLDDISLMVNFDMIGRLRSDQVRVQGTGTATEFDELLTPHFERSGLTVVAAPGGRGPSDHSKFYEKDIPVLFAFTGTHGDYHTPTDLGYKVNPGGAMKVLDMIEPVLMEVASRPQQLTFVESDEGDRPRRTGARVRLGIMPSYTAELDSGVLVEGVTDGTSAAIAGVLGGDIIVSWNGEAVEGGRRLFELLREAGPGDKVELGVLRNGDEQTLTVVLQPRDGA